MNQEQFEKRVLSLWMTTRIPLTRANLQFATGVSRRKLDKWLDALVAAGVLEVDADDDGEMIWSVRGAARSKTGPETPAELDKLEKLSSEARSGSSALAVISRGAGLTSPAKEGDKSIVASGILSFFFGPLGWLYAAPLKEAVPAIAVYIAMCMILPGFLLTPLLALINPLSALAGAAYAWRHNANGERTPLITSNDGPKLPPKR